MELLSYENPVFKAYVVAATSMIFLVVLTVWLTVARMMQEKGGYRAPEDLQKTPLNPAPHPNQTAPNERV